MKKIIESTWSQILAGLITMFIGWIVKEFWETPKMFEHVNPFIRDFWFILLGFLVFGLYRLLVFLKRIQETHKKLRLPLLTVANLYPNYDKREGITFKSKIRIVLRNDTQHDLTIRSASWREDGKIRLHSDHPKTLSLQTEEVRGGWKNEVNPNELPNGLIVGPGKSFRLWIGLDKDVPENELPFLQKNNQFGTLVLKIDGYDKDQEIHI